jgi:serine/threonine protein kinase
VTPRELCRRQAARFPRAPSTPPRWSPYTKSLMPARVRARRALRKNASSSSAYGVSCFFDVISSFRCNGTPRMTHERGECVSPSSEADRTTGYGQVEINPSAPALPNVGELVVGGKYRIESRLGEGGMGVVMAAKHVTLGHSVAFKFLKPSQVTPEVLERFLREARVAAQLDSEHVVSVSDVGQLDSGLVYMLMERLYGDDLEALLRNSGQLPLDQAVYYLLQVCDAVAAAHAAEIVHRDLKPANLFLARRAGVPPTIKVLDFGISKSIKLLSSNLTLTQPGVVLGSPRYMSPEQIRDEPVDGRSDIWSLGVVLYELLTASAMYDAETLSSLWGAILTDPPVPLRSKRPDVPAELEAVIDRCLQKRPDQRFATVAELAQALRPFASPAGLPLVERVWSRDRSIREARWQIGAASPAPGFAAHAGRIWARRSWSFLAAMLLGSGALAGAVLHMHQGSPTNVTRTIASARAPVSAGADHTSEASIKVDDKASPPPNAPHSAVRGAATTNISSTPTPPHRRTRELDRDVLRSRH